MADIGSFRDWRADHLTHCDVCRDTEDAKVRREAAGSAKWVARQEGYLTGDSASTRPDLIDEQVNKIAEAVAAEPRWVCARCGQGEDAPAGMPPFGWERIYAGPGDYELCPGCVVAFLAWLDEAARERRRTLAFLEQIDLQLKAALEATREPQPFDLVPVPAEPRSFLDRVLRRG